MRLLAGSSGFSYKEWKGPFYPAKLPAREMLAFYGGRLPAVEINNTFYRMPRASMLAGWSEKVPADFRFVLKAPQRITHGHRLEGSAGSVATFWKNAQALGERLGPVLFQLPPTFRCDLERLARFVGELPAGMRAAFEFRHPSWSEPDVTAALTDLLRDAGCALCVADTDDDEESPPVVVTGDWGYLRLRRTAYSDAELATWAGRVRAQPWREVFVFFKHEDAGAAPRMALRMMHDGAPAASERPWQ